MNKTSLLTIEEIKHKIKALAKKHQSSDTEDMDTEWLEIEANDLIAKFCVAQKYDVNGFPFKITDKNLDIEEYYNFYEYGSTFEAYSQYVERLALIKDDVADLMWCYTKSFWPEVYEVKADYLESLEALLDSGTLYEFEL